MSGSFVPYSERRVVVEDVKKPAIVMCRCKPMARCICPKRTFRMAKVERIPSMVPSKVMESGDPGKQTNLDAVVYIGLDKDSELERLFRNVPRSGK